MAIPPVQEMHLPLLKLCGDGNLHRSSEAYDILGEHFGMTEDDRAILQPSGSQPVFSNRVLWAKFNLQKAGLLESPSRGTFRITEAGQKVLGTKPKSIVEKDLLKIPQYAEFRRGRPAKTQDKDKHIVVAIQNNTPEELIADGFEQIQNALSSEIIDKVKSCSPRFFERLVLRLLLKMGYGGSLESAGQVVGKTGDGGIDGIIKEDKLGLDIIYIQAKRWEGVVGAGEVRNFSGSLDPHGAKKGVFITTSSFTKDAREFVTRLGEKKIVLIDGFELAQLMIDHDIGVSTVEVFPIKRLDSDYFEE